MIDVFLKIAGNCLYKSKNNYYKLFMHVINIRYQEDVLILIILYGMKKINILY